MTFVGPGITVRSVRRLGIGALAAITIGLIAASRHTLPMGLDAPHPIAQVAEGYSAESSGFVNVPDGQSWNLGIGPALGARLVLDHRVVETVQSRERAFSAVVVQPGVHRVLIQFDPHIATGAPALYYRQGTGREMPVPRTRLSPRRLSKTAWTLRRDLEWITLAVAFLWLAAIAALVFGPVRRWVTRARLEFSGDERALRTLLAFALAVFGYAMWWGVPNGWAEDELGPMDLGQLADLLRPGWHSKYPPMHMYVLGAVNTPILAGTALDLLATESPGVFAAMRFVNVLVSLAMALGITVIIYVCAARAAGARVGILAALFWVLTLPAAFYAKTANLDIPYTFWFAASLLIYQRAIERQSIGKYILFAVTATLAVVTKDQAYGLYLLPALHLAVVRCRSLGIAGALVRDAAIPGAVAAGTVLFVLVHNLLFNWHGFRIHVEMITGGGSQGYRMVDSASFAGQWWILLRTLKQIGWCLTWPGAALAFFGVVLGLRDRAARTRLIPFLLPAISYYLTFIAVVGYAYDRFVIPLCLMLAIFAGSALDRLWPAGAPRWRTAAAAALLVFMTLRSASISMLMAADSRYYVQRWMRANISTDSRVVFFESRELLPDLQPFRSDIIHDPMPYVRTVRPPVVLLSENFRRRFPRDAPEVAWYDALIRGELGYRVALRHRARVPFAIITREEQFRNPDPSFSVLHKVNAEFFVLVRNE